MSHAEVRESRYEALQLSTNVYGAGTLKAISKKRRSERHRLLRSNDSATRPRTRNQTSRAKEGIRTGLANLPITSVTCGRITMSTKQFAILVATIIVFGCGIFYRQASAQDSIPDYQGQNGTANQFQMFYGPRARADNFLVNTVTGQVWEDAQAKNGNTIFESVTVSPEPPVPGKLPIAGRYTIYFSPQSRSDQFLVDTLTGRVWEQYTNSDTGDEFFGEISVRGISERPASY